MGTPAAISAAVLAVLLWLLSRRRASGLDHQGAVGRPVPLPAATSRVLSPSAAPSFGAKAPSAANQAADTVGAPPLVRRQRLLRWAGQLNASAVQRLAAVDQMAGWGDRAAVPLLKRALRDPHPEVVAAAAVAMARFRGRSAAAQPAGAPSVRVARRPRNAGPSSQGG